MQLVAIWFVYILNMELNTVRYFYTDPIKAAWMAREFGVLFEEKRELPSGNSFRHVDGTPLSNKYIIAVDYDADRYYIHPDSHAMMEPHVGDRGIDQQGNAAYFDDSSAWIGEHDNLYALYPVELTRRNGKAWFAPEVESI